MTPSRAFGPAAALAATLALALPGGAAATPRAGEATIQQTFPLASRLCANLAAGKANRHIERFAAQVTADCTALQSTFTTAQGQVVAARAAIAPSLAAGRAMLPARCPQPRAALLACQRSRHAEEAASSSLAAQLHAATHLYYVTIEGARRTFWASIHALPGEHHARADVPIVPLPH